MTISLKTAAVAGAFALVFGTAVAQSTDTTGAATPAPTTEATNDRPLFANPFDPSTWYDAGAEHDHASMEPEAFNMAHPSFWMAFITPETHTKRHMQMTNPATYAQFMNPATYMEFAKPSNWLAWADLKNYAPLVEVKTYTYWMQPGAYMHAMNPAGYMQMFDMDNYDAYFDAETYTRFMDPATYDFSEAADAMESTADALNPASVFDYMTSMLTITE